MAPSYRIATIVDNATTWAYGCAVNYIAVHPPPPVWEDLRPMTVTTWNIDPAHTDVQFSAKHMMVTTVRGRFTAVEGTITLDEENPANSTGTFTVDVASLNTGVEQRDGHLRSADFFDADNHPTATFTATTVEPRGGSDYRGQRRPHHPRHDPPGHVRRRAARLLHRHGRRPPRRLPRHGPDQPRGLRADLERGPRERRLAGRQGHQAGAGPRGRAGQARSRR